MLGDIGISVTGTASRESGWINSASTCASNGFARAKAVANTTKSLSEPVTGARIFTIDMVSLSIRKSEYGSAYGILIDPRQRPVRGLGGRVWEVASRFVIVELYNGTGQSVCGVALIHASGNVARQLLPVRGAYFDSRREGLLMMLAATVVGIALVRRADRRWTA